MKLNLFYQEPDADRWLPFDRYPRRVARRLVRGPRKPGGMERYHLNLVDGLRRVGIPFRENSFAYAKSHRDEVVGIVGKGHLLTEQKWRNPIVFGPAVFSHPFEDPEALQCAHLRKLLVSCDWMKRMYEQATSVPVEVWASGVDTYTWRPRAEVPKDLDVLIYDKVRWQRPILEPDLIHPICSELQKCGLRFRTIRYGGYLEEEFRTLLARSRSMIFLVEHETQGFAYLQALSSGVAIFAWDRGGFWEDPMFFPERVRFSPVTSVPYWDERCGRKFANFSEFERGWSGFWRGVTSSSFDPRGFILENLTLERRAEEYAAILSRVAAEALF